jgi:hypothetical protein
MILNYSRSESATQSCRWIQDLTTYDNWLHMICLHSHTYRYISDYTNFMGVVMVWYERKVV